MRYLAFFIELAHWAVIIVGCVGQILTNNELYQNIFFGSFLHVSPIMLVFTGLASMGSDYHGHLSSLVMIGSILNACKYGTLLFSIRNDGLEGINLATVTMEAIYLAASGYYLFQLNIL